MRSRPAARRAEGAAGPSGRRLQGRDGRGARSQNSAANRARRIGSSQKEVYFEAKAPPTVNPHARKDPGEDRSDQAHSAYTARNMKSVIPRSVVMRLECATTFGSRTYSARARSAPRAPNSLRPSGTGTIPGRATGAKPE